MTQVRGDKDNPHFEGDTCVTGRAQSHYVCHPGRLLFSLKRPPDGRFEEIPVAAVIDEAAERLKDVVGGSGPQAVASYTGHRSKAVWTLP
jgi:anaerobic selenocysteine-containing dehydrogenase